jgi:hypothetical protein
MKLLVRGILVLGVCALLADETTACKWRCRRIHLKCPQPVQFVQDEDDDEIESAPAWQGSPARPKRGFNLLDAKNGLPKVDPRPEPKSYAFNGCAPEGTGGDDEINFLKNRVDVWETWYPVAFNTILDLPWPDGIPRFRYNWTSEQKAAVVKYEGLPISVEGYLADAKPAGKEACNCKSASKNMIDYHLSLVKSQDADRSECIVVEVTPRIRALHESWDISTFRTIKSGKQRLRISGWLLLDPFHPAHVDQGIRGTIWEIHPIMDIEIQQNGKWIKLDDWNGATSWNWKLKLAAVA